MGLNAWIAENSIIKKRISHPWCGEPTGHLSVTRSVRPLSLLGSNIDSTPYLIISTYLLRYSTGQWYHRGGVPNSAHRSTAWIATIPNVSSTRKHYIHGMDSASCTTSYDTETASSPSSTSTLTQPNFRSLSTLNPTHATLTPPNTLNTNIVPPPNPPTELHHYPPTLLFRPTSTVWWGPVEATVRHVKQTTYSTGHPSFLYHLLLSSGITRTVKETCLKTYTPTAPPSHSTSLTPPPPVHAPDVAPSTVLPSLPSLPARPKLPTPPTHAPRLPHSTFTPQLTLPPQPLIPSQPPVLSPKTFEQPIQQIISLHSFVEAMEKQKHHSDQQHRHYNRHQQQNFRTMQKQQMDLIETLLQNQPTSPTTPTLNLILTT